MGAFAHVRPVQTAAVMMFLLISGHVICLRMNNLAHVDAESRHRRPQAALEEIVIWLVWIAERFEVSWNFVQLVRAAVEQLLDARVLLHSADFIFVFNAAPLKHQHQLPQVERTSRRNLPMQLFLRLELFPLTNSFKLLKA